MLRRAARVASTGAAIDTGGGALLQIADVLTEHESCSKQHAVLQFRLVVVAAAKNVVGSKPKRKVKYVASGAVVDWHTAHGAPLPDRI